MNRLVFYFQTLAITNCQSYREFMYDSGIYLCMLIMTLILFDMFGKINLNNNNFQQLKKSNPSKNTQLHNQKIQSNVSRQKIKPVIAKNKKIKKQDRANLHKKYEDLQGAKFRLLNEMLYNNQSKQSLNYFKKNKEDFQLYHQGYRHQANKWKNRPVDQIIKYILQNRQFYSKKIIADLGCGQGFVYEELKNNGFNYQNIKSYDLISTKPFIIQADIAHLPLKDQTVDLCIFCLSLMGTNYLDFIREAWRVLKQNGQMIISQVQSRSSDWKKFIIMINLIGFTLINDGVKLTPEFQQKKQEPRFFRSIHFRKQINCQKRNSIKLYGKEIGLSQFSSQILEACTYKKR